ncbi:MAG: Uracil-DNA glycosylase superfamily [Gemmatimonadetes bacterium]|nr:Uracil-DNA glycosylase superfamily [Gemmatimonadota bacterium]
MPAKRAPIDPLDAHRASLAGCRTCALASGIVPIVSGARDPRVMLVGQAPGKVESGGGQPFAGRAGATLWKWLGRAGISEAEARERIYIAAVTRCFPGPHPGGRGDRVPTPREREQCRAWLDDELRIIRPRLLVLVGKLAIESFLGAVSLDGVVGRELTVTHEGGESLAIPLPHPSGASSRIHQAGHDALLSRALDLLRARYQEVEGGAGRRVA